MSEKEFLIYLDEAQENRYRYWHVWEQGKIIEFRIQYEAFISGSWHPVVRYDSAHGHPHRDDLHPNAPETKEWFPEYRNADVLSTYSARYGAARPRFSGANCPCQV